jgi:NTP pyrophosphatase (non-canonical NTP hydrolase)
LKIAKKAVKAKKAARKSKPWTLVQGKPIVTISGSQRGLKMARDFGRAFADVQIKSGVGGLCTLAYDIAEARGWHHNPQNGRRIKLDVPKAIALQHSELSEALEAHRTDAMDDKLPNRKGLEVELADAIIRICHLAKWAKLDVAGAIVEKCRFNETRKDHKRGSRAGKGGKRY